MMLWTGLEVRADGRALMSVLHAGRDVQGCASSVVFTVVARCILVVRHIAG